MPAAGGSRGGGECRPRLPQPHRLHHRTCDAGQPHAGFRRGPRGGWSGEGHHPLLAPQSVVEVLKELIPAARLEGELQVPRGQVVAAELAEAQDNLCVAGEKTRFLLGHRVYDAEVCIFGRK